MKSNLRNEIKLYIVRHGMTTAATPHGVWMRFPPFTRVWQRRRWSAGELSLTAVKSIDKSRLTMRCCGS